MPWLQNWVAILSICRSSFFLKQGDILCKNWDIHYNTWLVLVTIVWHNQEGQRVPSEQSQSLKALCSIIVFALQCQHFNELQDNHKRSFWTVEMNSKSIIGTCPLNDACMKVSELMTFCSVKLRPTLMQSLIPYNDTKINAIDRRKSVSYEGKNKWIRYIQFASTDNLVYWACSQKQNALR